MTDPGAFSTMQNEEKNISAVVITHEHQDHLHIDSLKKVLVNNPDCVVVTNTAVGKLLDEAGIAYVKVEAGQMHDISGVKVAGFGTIHAEIYGDQNRVQNTGYMIDVLCYPGDAFENPNCAVDILALPVAGPWMRIKDAIDYAKMIKPRIIFPVHDAILRAEFTTFIPQMVSRFLAEDGIEVKSLELSKEEDL